MFIEHDGDGDQEYGEGKQEKGGDHPGEIAGNGAIFLLQELIEGPGEDNDKGNQGKDAVFPVSADIFQEGEMAIEDGFYGPAQAKDEEQCAGDQKNELKPVFFAGKREQEKAEADERKI